MKMLLRSCALLLALWLPGAQAAAQVRAWLDRDTMQLGETVALNIEATGTGAAAPDFEALKNDFDVLDPSSSSSVNIVGGQATSKQLWGVSLQPKRTGKLTIPALPVAGTTTQPLAITVAAAPADAGGNEELMLEVTAEPQSPYVQQQVALSVKVFVGVNLSDYELDPLQADGLVVQKLGQGRAYDAERGGRRYRVVEQRYAGLPERSGAINLPSLRFRGRAPSGNDPSALFFGRGRMVSAQSKPLTLDVKPRPPQSGSGPWLPAQTVELSAAGIDPAAGGKVGEPLTLTVTSRAQGLGFEQLPEIVLPPIDGAEVYPDKPVTRTRDNGIWLFGERSRKFAIVPIRPGTLHLPPITLDWWDVARDQAATATIPAQDVEIATGAAGASPVVPAAAENRNTASNPVAVPSDTSTVAEPAFWRPLALASLGLWLLSVVVFVAWWRTRGSARPVSQGPRPAASEAMLGSRGAFTRAANGGDAARCARALLQWSQAEGIAARNLGELSQALDAATQRAAIDALQRASFAVDGSGTVPTEVAAAFANGFARRTARPASNDDAALPPLWPKSSHR